MNHSLKTIELLKNGKLTAARQEFGQALQQDTPPDDLYHLAEELYLLGFSDLAAQAYKNLLQKFPDEDLLKVALADLAVDQGKDDEALNYLAAIQPTSDAYLNALLVAADLYQTQGLFEVSEQKLLAAQRIAPTEEAVTFGLAELYFNMKEYHKALKLYLQLVKEGSATVAGGVHLVKRLAQVSAAAGKLEQALGGYFEQVSEADFDPDTRFQLAFTQFQLKDYEGAIKNFKKLAAAQSDYTTLYPYLGKAYEEQGGLLQEALEAFKQGLRYDEYNIKLYQEASNVSLKLQQPQAATDYLKKALELEPDNLTLVIELSNLLLSRQRYQETIDFLSMFLQADEVDPQLYWNMGGQAYNALEKEQDAFANYQAAAASFSDNPDFLREFAFVSRAAGHLKKAQENVVAYLKIVPNDLEMQDLKDELFSQF
nr:tetratricopeptide repeat protein [Liquorilactobacillus satsumensis]